MDERDWDEVWSDMDEGGAPDALIVGLDLEPGRSIDLGCGMGHNVLELARKGWDAHGADSSAVAMSQARSAVERLGLEATFVTADLTRGIPNGTYDLITMFYVHLQTDEHAVLMGRIADSLNPGGTFIYVGHDEEFAESHHGHMGDLEHGDHDHHDHDHGDHGSDDWADREIGGPDRISSLLTGLAIDRADKETRTILHGPQEIEVTDVIVIARKA